MYKYSETPVPAALVEAVAPTRFLPTVTLDEYKSSVPIDYTLPKAAGRVTIHIWNRFGKQVRKLIDVTEQESGSKSVVWDGTDDSGKRLPTGIYIYRLTVDGDVESRVIYLTQ